MKNLLCCLAFLVALFQPSFSQAATRKANTTNAIACSPIFSHNYGAKNNDLSATDDLSALNDDDDEQHFSERKIIIINASNRKASYAAAINAAGIFLKGNTLNKFYFQLHSALFIFLHSLRV